MTANTDLSGFVREDAAPQQSDVEIFGAPGEVFRKDINAPVSTRAFPQFEGYTPEQVRNVLLGEDDEGFQLAVRATKGRVAEALSAFKGVQPSVAAKAQRLVEGTGLPTDLALNSPDLREWLEASAIQRDLFSKIDNKRYKYPGLMSWWIDPENMKATRDDAHALMQIEALLRGSYDSGLSQAWYSFRQGTKSLGRNLVSLAEGIERNGLRNTYGYSVYPASAAEKDPEGFKPVDIGGGLTVPAFRYESFKNEDDAILKRYARWKDADLFTSAEIRDQGYTNAVAATAPQIVGTALAALAARRLGISPAMAGGTFAGSLIAGSTYETGIERGASHTAAMDAALFNAVAQGYLESVGLGKVFGLFGKTTKAGLPGLIAGSEALATEWFTEFSQQFLDEAANIYTELNAEKISSKDFPSEFAKRYIDRLPQTMKEGAYEGLVTVPFAVLGAGAAVANAEVRAYMSRQEIEMTRRVQEIMSGTRTWKEAPERLQAFLTHLNRDAGSNTLKKFFIKARDMLTLYQDDRESLKQAAETLGFTEEQVVEAAQRGTDLEGNIETWLSATGSDANARLQDDVRFSEEGLTLRELRVPVAPNEYAQALREALEALGAYEEDTKVPEPFKVFRDQLVNDLGMPAGNADASIQVALSLAKNLAAKRGETVEEWVDRKNLRMEVVGDQAVFMYQDNQPVTSFPVDRRMDQELRKRIERMTPEQQYRAVYLSQLTGLPNKRAFYDSANTPFAGSIDVDGLGKMNDTMGHKAGDALLAHVGEAFKQSGYWGFFHVSGDEFYAKGNTFEEIEAAAQNAYEWLQNNPIEIELPDGRIVKGKVGFSYGIGTNLDEAEANLGDDKARRELSGERARKGTAPDGFLEISPEGVEAPYRWQDRFGKIAPAPQTQTITTDPVTNLAEINSQPWLDAEVQVDNNGEAATVQAGALAENLSRRANALQALLSCVGG